MRVNIWVPLNYPRCCLVYVVFAVWERNDWTKHQLCLLSSSVPLTSGGSGYRKKAIHASHFPSFPWNTSQPQSARDIRLHDGRKVLVVGPKILPMNDATYASADLERLNLHVNQLVWALQHCEKSLSIELGEAFKTPSVEQEFIHWIFNETHQHASFTGQLWREQVSVRNANLVLEVKLKFQSASN